MDKKSRFLDLRQTWLIADARSVSLGHLSGETAASMCPAGVSEWRTTLMLSDQREEMLKSTKKGTKIVRDNGFADLHSLPMSEGGSAELHRVLDPIAPRVMAISTRLLESKNKADCVFFTVYAAVMLYWMQGTRIFYRLGRGSDLRVRRGMITAWLVEDAAMTTAQWYVSGMNGEWVF